MDITRNPVLKNSTDLTKASDPEVKTSTDLSKASDPEIKNSTDFSKAFDPKIDDIMYMDMTGGSKPRKSSWTSHNVDLYMNSAKNTPRTYRRVKRTTVGRELWKSDIDLIPTRPDELCLRFVEGFSARAASYPVLGGCDTPVHTLPFPAWHTDTAVSNANKMQPLNVNRPDSASCEQLSNVIDKPGTDNDTPPKATHRCCGARVDAADSPVYMSPNCESCNKQVLLDVPVQRLQSTDSESDADATYMSINSIQLDNQESKISSILLDTPESQQISVKPPELPKRNLNPLLTSENITQKMCRCREVRKQCKRAIHLEDPVKGVGSRVYTVKDIVDNVDELIGDYCEDTTLSAFTVQSHKSLRYNLFHKPRSSVNNLLKRPKSVTFTRNGDSSKDSGIESHEHKTKSSENVKKARRCKLTDCSNCQELDGIKEDDGGTLDCYSYAYSKRLPVEAYVPQSTTCKKCTESLQQPLRKLRRSKSLFQYIPSVTSVVAPKLSDVSESHLYRSLVNKASKIRHSTPFSLTKYNVKTHKQLQQESTDKVCLVSLHRNSLNDLNNNRYQNEYVEDKMSKALRRSHSDSYSHTQSTPRETAC